MTLLAVVKDVCEVVGVQAPASVFTNIAATRTMQEMLALANEMAQRIAFDTRDWTLLKKSQTMTGDGIKTSFALPADFRRMLLTANVRRSTSQQPMRFVPDYDEWLKRRAQNIYDGNGEWTIAAGRIAIAPTLGVGQTAYFPYLHRNCITLNSGGVGDAFINDLDVFALDERVLKLGMIWQWKAWKGSPYAEDVGTYGDALTNLMGHDSPAPILIQGRPASLAANTAYPWPVPTP